MFCSITAVSITYLLTYITACAGGYQSLSNFIQLRLRPFSTALMTLPRQAAARSDLTARGRPAATHVHQLVAAVMVDSMKPHDDVGTSPYAAGSPDNIMGSNLPDNITDSNLLDQATTGGLPLDELITGSKPGMPASTRETCVLGSAPKAVVAPENSLALDLTWACTSSPMTSSQSPVAPLIT